MQSAEKPASAASGIAAQSSSAYSNFLAEDPVAGPSAAAIKALTQSIKTSSASTIMGLREVLSEAGAALSSLNDAPMSIASLCELFVRFVTRTALEARDFDECKRLLIERGEMLARTTIEARSKIAKFGAPFVDTGGVVLTLGYSRTVVALLLKAAKAKHFSVVVAESHPKGVGHETAKQLSEAGVPVTMIEDAAVGYMISRCQMVLCGAEAVLESGGVINKTGTYQMAIIAHACKKPVYIASESTKFARLFPLSQSDWPGAEHESPLEHAAFVGHEEGPPPGLIVEKPSRDYTPPLYITLLFTDLGVLTPSAVSDELIKLFD
mmetsp:Transcript_1153/g.3186  ORF Transcript_1153/g.3186 Transcript_1153/m.3186 type:complete len:323 (-) Transcript_1153:487-1455(-)